MLTPDPTEMFGDTVPSPATAKAPAPQDHLPGGSEPSPVQPRDTMATTAEAKDVLSRLSFFDLTEMAMKVEAYRKNNSPLAEALAKWANVG